MTILLLPSFLGLTTGSSLQLDIYARATYLGTHWNVPTALPQTTTINNDTWNGEADDVTSTEDFITVIVEPSSLDIAGNFGTIGGLQIVAVSEPSSLAFLGLGLAGLLGRRRR